MIEGYLSLLSHAVEMSCRACLVYLRHQGRWECPMRGNGHDCNGISIDVPQRRT